MASSTRAMCHKSQANELRSSRGRTRICSSVRPLKVRSAADILLPPTAAEWMKVCWLRNRSRASISPLPECGLAKDIALGSPACQAMLPGPATTLQLLGAEGRARPVPRALLLVFTQHEPVHPIVVDSAHARSDPRDLTGFDASRVKAPGAALPLVFVRGCAYRCRLRRPHRCDVPPDGAHRGGHWGD